MTLDQEMHFGDFLFVLYRNSLVLAVLTIILYVPLCLLLGTLAGLFAGRKADYAISLGALSIGARQSVVFPPPWTRPMPTSAATITPVSAHTT